MKTQYIAPTLERVALPSQQLMTAVSIRGTEGGEARSHEFYGSFAWDEEPDEEDADFGL